MTRIVINPVANPAYRARPRQPRKRMMDIRLAKLGDEISLSERPPPATPVYARKYLLFNWLHMNFQIIFSGKKPYFPEK